MIVIPAIDIIDGKPVRLYHEIIIKENCRKMSLKYLKSLKRRADYII